MDIIKDFKSHPYISENVSVSTFEEPFKHIVIDNFFKKEIYRKLSFKFQEYILRQSKPHGQVGSNPSNFYEAIIYGIQPQDCIHGFDFFVDPMWKIFMSKIFNIEFNQHISYGQHLHYGSPEKKSKDGWVHKDIGICSAINDPLRQTKIVHDCEYADDSTNQPNTTKIIRSVAVLFYLNNKDNPSEEDGGGTGIYTSLNKNDLVKTIEPINNRLFAFEISPISYHAFIGANFNRNTIIHWFHSNPSYYVHKHLDKFKTQFKKENTIFERWKKDNLWSLEEDPEYSKYFDKPFNQILN